MWRRLTRHSCVIRTYQSGSEPGINCSKRYSDINLVVVTHHSGGVHCSLMCCMTPGGPCDLQPHVEGGPVSHTTGDVTWRSSAPWRIRQWGKTARRSCKPYVLSLPRQVWLLGYHCAHHENNLFCRNKWSLDRFVCFIRQICKWVFLNPVWPSGHYRYHQCNIQQFNVLPTQCIYVFCVDLRTNSDYFPIQH